MSRCRRSRASLVLAPLLLASLLGACQEDAPPLDPARALQAGRLESFRASFDERAAQVCRRRATDQSPFADRCTAASIALNARLAELIESSPIDWEKRVLGLGGICLREANRYSQAEIAGRSEPELFVEALERGPACLAEQYELLEGKAREAGVL